MAMLHADGFDRYAAAADLYSLFYAGSTMSLSTTGGRFGGGAVFSNGGGNYIKFTGTLALELWTGFAINFSDATNNDRCICSFTSGGSSDAGVEGMVTYNGSSGVIKAWRGAINTLLGSSATTITTGWHWIDVHYKYSATVGIFEVWLDGVQLINLTSQNTARNAGQTSLTGVQLVSANNSGANTCYFDDWVINDTTGAQNNGRVGDSKIETLVPTLDATPNNGTPSTGVNHYAVVDEVPWNTTDYITMTNTTGQEELFGFSSLSSTPVSIAGAIASFIGQNSDAGSANLETVVKSSTTESDGASTALTSSWKLYRTILELDPNTSAAWGATAVNAVKAGWKVP
jgi:hypothetical protein